MDITDQPMNGAIAALRMVLGVRAAEDGDPAQMLATIHDLNEHNLIETLTELARLLSVYVELQHGEGTDAMLRANLAAAVANGG
ncbi:hypothetical protein ABH922_001256 [Rhodococcus sp. 27YEA15]|uniref:hypothetical protein n=1 Tax=Rhodococcus sp. 27YEA15 TaxID=3156259 RepID=UPI003C7B676C